MKNRQGCEGCRLSKAEVMRCDLSNYYYSKEKEQTFKCPCIKCLVKGMCGQYCNDYYEYVGGYSLHIKSDPSDYVANYMPQYKTLNSTCSYTYKSLKGIPIMVKYDKDGHILKLGKAVINPNGTLYPSCGDFNLGE